MAGSDKSTQAKSVIRIFKAHSEGKIPSRRLRMTAERVMEAEGWNFPVQIIVADDRELQRLHAQFLHDNTPTDVISFPGDPQDDFPAEIYISLDQAQLQAEEADEPVAKALNRLLVHGLLHLGGWSDDTEEQRTRMIEYGERYVE